jgi:uncharacterized integral membrane protein (TIGR00698 family)
MISNMGNTSKRALLPGFLIATATGVAIWFLSTLSPAVDPLVAGILGGMILRTVIGERQVLSPGLNWAPKLLIPPGIILYGANLRFDFDIVSPLTWLQILIGLTIVVWLARTIGKWLKLPDATSSLLAVGTAICGASAIVIASDTVGGTKRDTTISILVITIWGLVGLALLPLIANLFQMNTYDEALLYSTTLHQTGLVKSAAMRAGSDCLSIATAIKTARIATIIPLLLAVGTLRYLPSVLETAESKATFTVKIPWYLWGFLAVGLCFSFIPILGTYTPILNQIKSIIWTMAMVSIGLSVDAKRVIRSLGKPLIAGLIIWIGLLAVFFYTFIVS